MEAVDDVCVDRADDEKDRPILAGGADTALRCGIALFIIRVGMRMVEFGAGVTSDDHHGGRVYATAVEEWRDRTRQMPWRGIVPTRSRPVTVTQGVWLVAAALMLDTMLYMVGLPHVHLYGMLRDNLPRLVVTVRDPGPH